MSKTKATGLAPAIVYAFKILDLISDGHEYKVQDMVRELGAPKSSVLRYLATMEDVGLIWKNPINRTYKTNIRVVTDSEEDPVFEKKRKVIMHELCNLSRRTVEWFEPTDEGMVLRDRISPPESVVSAKVSVGSVFVWGESPGAVRLLAGSRYFTGKPATDIESRKYVSHGVAVPITPAESHERMQDVKKKKVLADEFCNPHGTRRIAAVVEKSGKFIGILSIIEVVLHPNVAENRDYLPALEKQAEMLSS